MPVKSAASIACALGTATENSSIPIFDWTLIAISFAFSTEDSG